MAKGIAIGLVAFLLFVISDAIVGIHAATTRLMRKLRRAKIENEIAPLTWSIRHKPIIPLMLGMADELAVREIAYTRQGDHVRVELDLDWWARPRFLYKQRLARKAAQLLVEGGVRVKIR
jgi:hypothetical protein